MSTQFSRVLHDLVRDPRWAHGTLDESLRALTEAASQALRSERVSFWEMAPDGLRCIHLFDATRDSHESGAFLPIHAFPDYFEAIAAARVMAVEDAVSDPRTVGLAEGYLIPLGIGALLDAPVVIDGEITGVVCHESLGPPRAWTEPEQSFAASIGDLFALAQQTARLRATEERLRRREREVRIALDAAGAADWSWEMQTDEVRWSNAVGPLFGKPRGWQPPDMATYMELIHPDDRVLLSEALATAIDNGGDYFVEHRVVWGDGQVHWLQCRGQVLFGEDGAPKRVTGIASDHTLRREFELRLQRSDRLESLGRLAGGVSHDFNNLLTAILGSAELLRTGLTDPDQHERLDLIEAAAERAAELTRQLLAFSRRLPKEPRVVDLSATVGASLQLIERLVGEDVQLGVELGPVMWVRADPAQLEQVVMNLAVNARDAMPNGGSLTIRTEPATLDGAAAAALVVTDTGSGIEPAILGHIFDPFFSTKQEHQGTGLGLALCHGVVEQYDGNIAVDSTVGQGTTFRIRLPLAEPPPTEASVEPTEGPMTALPRDVLVIEDDRMVAVFILEVLKQAGHNVTHLTNGDEAIAWLADHRPQAVVTDVVLEGARGTEVARVAREQDPDLPILLITGYAPEQLPKDLVDLDILHKPFRVVDLQRWLAGLTPPQ